jgi:predicted phage tail protein
MSVLGMRLWLAGAVFVAVCGLAIIAIGAFIYPLVILPGAAMAIGGVAQVKHFTGRLRKATEERRRWEVLVAGPEQAAP